MKSLLSIFCDAKRFTISVSIAFFICLAVLFFCKQPSSASRISGADAGAFFHDHGIVHIDKVGGFVENSFSLPQECVLAETIPEVAVDCSCVSATVDPEQRVLRVVISAPVKLEHAFQAKAHKIVIRLKADVFIFRVNVTWTNALYVSPASVNVDLVKGCVLPLTFQLKGNEQMGVKDIVANSNMHLSWKERECDGGTCLELESCNEGELHVVFEKGIFIKIPVKIRHSTDITFVERVNNLGRFPTTGVRNIQATLLISIKRGLEIKEISISGRKVHFTQEYVNPCLLRIAFTYTPQNNAVVESEIIDAVATNGSECSAKLIVIFTQPGS